MLTTAGNKVRPTLPAALRGRLLLGFTLSLACGIAGGAAWGLTAGGPALGPLLVTGGGLLLCLLTHKDFRPALLLLGAALGLFLYGAQTARLDAWPGQAGETVVVEGRSRGAAQPYGRDGHWRLTLLPQKLNGHSLRCAPLYIYGEGAAPLAGSRLWVRATVMADEGYGNPLAFAYGRVLRNQGLAGALSTFGQGEIRVLAAGPRWSLAQLGAQLRAALDRAAAPLPDRQRALIYGVYLGDDSGLEEELQSALGLAGMLHAFAVSGLHVGYIVLLGALLGGRGYGRRQQRALLTCGLLLIYLLLTGAEASVCRAMLMALCLLAGQVLDEKNDTPTALATAALLCLLWRPGWLLDSGFQLSYLTVSGMLILGPPLRQALGRGTRLPRLLVDSLALTLAATLFALPAVAYYFYYISLWGWLLSPLVIAAAGLAVAAGMAATWLAPLLPLPAGLLLEAGGWALSVPARLAELLAAQPLAAWWTGALPGWYVALFYGLLLALSRLRRRLLPALLLAVLAFVLLPQAVYLAQEPENQVVFLDVGQGDATLLRLADGATVLIDGGGDPLGNRDVGRLALLPYLRSQGLGRIDLLVSTHPDADHLQGLLTVLAEMEVTTVAWAAAAADNPLQAQLEAAAKAAGAEIWLLSAGQRCQVGQELTLEVLSPTAAGSDESNADSLVLLASCQGVRILLPGDADGDTLNRLAAKGGVAADVLKLPHHGSGESYAEYFYQRVAPSAVIISVGAENRYGHPAQNVLDYWQQRAVLYRTDRNGAIILHLQNGAYRPELTKETSGEDP